MLLIVVLPLFALAASMAWEDYRTVAAQLRQQLDLTAVRGAARAIAALDDTERWLRVIALLPAVQGGPAAACDVLLGQLLQLERARFDGLAVIDRSGQLRCSAEIDAVTAPQGGLAGLLSISGPAGPVGLVIGDPLDKPRPMLPIGVWLAGESSPSAVLATLSLQWLARRVQNENIALDQVAALIDSHDRVVPLGAATPAVTELARPPGSPVPADASTFQFRTTPLLDGLRLLVGSSTRPRLRQARQSLVQRLSALGLLLVAGLAAMTAGVDSAVVQPVQKLSAAVARWREGARFEPGLPGGAPREIATLSASFGRAIAALNDREVQLREATTQQELLMQEIHHRVKNNLQIVASLLNLQASRIKLPEARAEFQAARDRIRALATLHRHLYAYGELHTINMRSFLIELCSQLLQALGETPAGGRIRLDIEAPELRISSDQAVPMALIVTEAVSNAAKYAFPGGRSGHIAVRLLIVDEGSANETLRLTIEDDGIGISSGRAETVEGSRDGIGTHLIRGFARQLQAKMSLTHDGGTRYMLDIPLHRRPAETVSEPMPEA